MSVCHTFTYFIHKTSWCYICIKVLCIFIISALEESVQEEDDEMPAEWESHYFGANESNTSQFSGKKRGNFRKVCLFIC